MWQSPYSEDSSSFASQETPLILWKMKELRVCRYPEPDQSNPCPLPIYFTNILILSPPMSMASKWPLPLKFPIKTLYAPLLYGTRATCPALQFLLIRSAE